MNNNYVVKTTHLAIPAQSPYHPFEYRYFTLHDDNQVLARWHDFRMSLNCDLCDSFDCGDSHTFLNYDLFDSFD